MVQQPMFRYKPGTMLGAVQYHNGAYTEKLVTLKVVDKATGEEKWLRVKQHIYGKVVWFWTGYRWVPCDGNENIEARRDARRWKIGLRLDANDKWYDPSKIVET